MEGKVKDIAGNSWFKLLLPKVITLCQHMTNVSRKSSSPLHKNEPIRLPVFLNSVTWLHLFTH